jgi:hypothetical protein
MNAEKPLYPKEKNMMLKSFISNLRHYQSKFQHKYFDWEVKDILKAPALSPAPAHTNLCVLTMLCKRDFFQYLISIYSFTRYVSPEKIVIVNDGSLEPWHLDHLHKVIPRLEILEGANYIDDRLPTYTSWRRMLAIESLIDKYYVIQLDADLYAQHDLTEIVDAVRSNTPFILGTPEGQIISVDIAKAKAEALYGTNLSHVQQAVEVNLDSLKSAGLQNYVRGCAGFAGYPKGSFNKDKLLSISQCMFSRIGDKWREWGSEQCCANILIANMPEALVLSQDSYASVGRYHPEQKLTHFIGSIRFKDGIYNKLAKSFVGELVNPR